MIVFLSETWLNKEHMKWVLDKIIFYGCFTMPYDGKGTGLAFLWKVGVNVWVDSFLNYHINSIVHGGSENA